MVNHVLTTIEIDSVVIDAGTQMRNRICEETVQRYVDTLENLPPVHVVSVGRRFVLVDGFHRYYASNIRGCKTIQALVVKEGTLQDAQLVAACANQTHGLPRTNEDKRNAVRCAIKLMPEASDRAIGALVGVDGKTVAAVRKENAEPAPTPEPLTDEDIERWNQDEDSDSEVKPKSNTTKHVDVPADQRLAEAKRRIAGLEKALNQWWREALRVMNEPAGSFIEPAQMSRLVEEVAVAIRFGKPAAICPRCKGGRCPACRENGYVPTGRARVLQNPEPQAGE